MTFRVMPSAEQNKLTVTHLEDLTHHAGYRLIEEATEKDLARCCLELERAKGDDVPRLQGKIEKLRWVRNLPKQLFDQAKLATDNRTLE